MKVLVINAGSSSMKFTLFQMEDQKVLAKGVLSDQLSLFEQPELYTVDEKNRRDQEAAEEAADERERRLQAATLKMQAKYGKNAVLRGVSYREGATGRDRNKQIGGHRAGEEDDLS